MQGLRFATSATISIAQSTHATNFTPALEQAFERRLSSVASGSPRRMESSKYMASYTLSVCWSDKSRHRPKTVFKCSGSISTGRSSNSCCNPPNSSRRIRPRRTATMRQFPTSIGQIAGTTADSNMSRSRKASVIASASSGNTHDMATEQSKTNAISGGVLPRSSHVPISHRDGAPPEIASSHQWHRVSYSGRLLEPG